MRTSKQKAAVSAAPAEVKEFVSAAEVANARLIAIVESSDDAIVSKDLNGIITSWNAAAEQLFGYTADEAIGRSIMMIIPEDRADEESVILRHIRAGERIEHFETLRRRKDGTLVDLSVTISPIVDARGRTQEAGFDAHMIKPVDLNELMKLLASFDKTGRPAALDG